MMSIDPAHATENLQHTIDDATGALKSQLEATSSYVVKNAQEAQVTTKATVQDVAVESMTDNSAVVLVVAKSDTINADKVESANGVLATQCQYRARWRPAQDVETRLRPMNSESESPLDDAETAHEDADSDDAGTETPSSVSHPAEPQARSTGSPPAFSCTGVQFF